MLDEIKMYEYTGNINRCSETDIKVLEVTTVRKHFWKRLMALLLIVSMLTMDFGTPLFAVTDDTRLSEDTAFDDAASDSTSEEADLAADSEENTPVTTQEALILSEVEEEREESTKTFMLNDGTFMLAQYAVLNGNIKVGHGGESSYVH